ncbi:MAG: hypothetical protein JWR20_2016 [Marmoricola sp.]|nr:hypothetical protein [Marmoricola sp.]
MPDAEDLWWSWVVLSALHRAAGDRSCGFDPEELVLSLDAPDGSWLRLQRVLGSRLVLWGRSALAAPAPADARRGAPDWALSQATHGDRPTVVAWHAHGEWDLSHHGEDDGLLPLLRPVLAVDPRLVAVARAGDLDADRLAAHLPAPRPPERDLEAALALVAAADAAPAAGPAVSVLTRLRDQVHQQMRDAVERHEAADDPGGPGGPPGPGSPRGSGADRVLLQRPPAVVHWARTNGPGTPFTWSVMWLRGEAVPGAGNTRLPDPVRRSLTNVLAELHRSEAGEESGAWLFARVHSPDGVVVAFDRAFDSWPDWYAVHHRDRGPSLADLAWEMSQRAPAWRPAWASLLPPP